MTLDGSATAGVDELQVSCVNCGRMVEPDGLEGFGHVAAALPGDDPRAKDFLANPCPHPQPNVAVLFKIIRDEQMLLWNDLDDAIRYAVGAWSMGCQSAAARIVRHARVIGPTPVGSVPWSLSSSGVYEALLDQAGVVHEKVSDAEWERLDVQMVAGQQRSRGEWRELLRETTAEIPKAWLGIEYAAGDYD